MQNMFVTYTSPKKILYSVSPRTLGKKAFSTVINFMGFSQLYKQSKVKL